MSRSNKPTNSSISKKLLTECQATITFACFDSPGIVQAGDSMTEVMMKDKMTELYFGGDDNPDLINFVDQVVGGLNKFKGLFKTSEPNASGQTFLFIPPNLHRSGENNNVHIGPKSLTKDMLCRKLLTTGNIDKIMGRTLLRQAKEVFATCKVMMGYVTASDSPYRDGNFRLEPTGTTTFNGASSRWQRMLKNKRRKIRKTINSSQQHPMLKET